MNNPHYPVNTLMEKLKSLFENLEHNESHQIAFNKGLSKRIIMHQDDRCITEVAELDSYNQIVLYDNFANFIGVYAIVPSLS